MCDGAKAVGFDSERNVEQVFEILYRCEDCDLYDLRVAEVLAELIESVTFLLAISPDGII